jgi:hypothetical protein
MSFAQRDKGFNFHGGQTARYSSAVAYDPGTRTGIVVLSNSAEKDGGLCWHLMRPGFPMASSTAEKAREENLRKEKTLNSGSLDRYAGKYRVASGPTAGDVVTIERRTDALVFKTSSTPPQGLRLHAENDEKFFITETDLQITFQTNSQDRATSLTIHFAGTDTPVTRIVSESGEK